MPKKVRMDTVRGLGIRALAIGASLSIMSAPLQARTLGEEQASVQQTQARIEALSKKMAALLDESRALDDALTSTSASLAVQQVMLRRKQMAAAQARASLNARAAEAYKRGLWRQAHMLLGVKTYSEILSFSEYLSGAIDDDNQAYLRYNKASEELAGARVGVEEDKRRLAQAERRAEAIKVEIAEALAEEQKILSQKKAELAALEAQRRRVTAPASGVSPVVAARRAARQIELDKKLAALLAWYAPGSGAEPFMPSMLKPTGIVSNGYATWYGPGFNGRRAASGATYDQRQLTAASLVLPFGTLLKVTLNNKSAIVVITDRGPYVANRVLDLSWGASQAIGHSGVKMVRMEIVVPSAPGAPAFP